MADKNLVHQNGDRLFVTSLDISNRFGRQHKDVLEAVRNLDCSPEFGRRNFTLSSYNNSQNKAQPMYEITRDGFVFLCMGFTGPQAALWKERYITAFNEMEAALRQPAALPAVAHSPRLEASMAQLVQSTTALTQHIGDVALIAGGTAGAMLRMEKGMATLAQGMDTVLTQLNVTKKYIGLLELNQAGTRRVTAEVAHEAKLLKAEGMSNADIGRLLRISRTTVSLIVRDKYQVNIPAGETPKLSAGEILEDWIEREQQHIAGTLDAMKGGE